MIATLLAAKATEEEYTTYHPMYSPVVPYRMEGIDPISQPLAYEREWGISFGNRLVCAIPARVASCGRVEIEDFEAPAVLRQLSFLPLLDLAQHRLRQSIEKQKIDGR